MFIFWLMFFLLGCAGQNGKKRHSSQEKRRTNHFWVWHQLVPACGRPEGAWCPFYAPDRHHPWQSFAPRAIHGCRLLPEVAVKAFSINSLSEFQYILSIWPLAKTLQKNIKTTIIWSIIHADNQLKQLKCLDRSLIKFVFF